MVNAVSVEGNPEEAMTPAKAPSALKVQAVLGPGFRVLEFERGDAHRGRGGGGDRLRGR